MTDSQLIRVLEPRILPQIIRPQSRQNQPFLQKREKQTQDNSTQLHNIARKNWIFHVQIATICTIRRVTISNRSL